MVVLALPALCFTNVSRTYGKGLIVVWLFSHYHKAFLQIAEGLFSLWTARNIESGSIKAYPRLYLTLLFVHWMSVKESPPVTPPLWNVRSLMLWHDLQIPGNVSGTIKVKIKSEQWTWGDEQQGDINFGTPCTLLRFQTSPIPAVRAVYW